MSAPGRYIRIALVLFPLGLVLTSIASFGIWWWKRQQVEERGYGYALALRRDMTPAALDRYSQILGEVMAPAGQERLSAVASFLDSSMSPENMGYDPRRDRFFHNGMEVSNVDVEITGKPRWQEVTLVLAPYGDAARTATEIQALSGMMALAHAMTGERRQDTLRFAAVPLGVLDEGGRTALARLAAATQERGERVMRLCILGGPAPEVLTQVREVFRVDQTGTIVESLPATGSTEATLKAMSALKARL